MSISVLMVSVV